MAGLLDTIIGGYKNGAGLLAPTDKDLEMRAAIGKEMAGFLPGIGDVLSAKDSWDQYRQGNYGMAALAGLGALPGIPGIAGHITDIKPPRWNAGRISMPVGVEPTPSEIKELLRDDQAKSAYNTLRALLSKQDGSVMYAWPADAALHQDIGKHFNINPSDVTHGLIAP